MNKLIYSTVVHNNFRSQSSMARTAFFVALVSMMKTCFTSLLQTKTNLKVLPLVLFSFISTTSLWSQTTPVNFSFSLSVNAKTSAGVFKTDGTLIRTLWSGVDYTAGSYTKTWDKKDDKGNVMSGLNFVIKVVSNNVSYSWDGVVGNTSTDKTGKNKVRHLRTMYDMCFGGTKGYYCTDFVEGNSSANVIQLSNIQTKNEVTPAVDGDVNLAISGNATDGSYVYWAGFDYFGSKSFTYATKVSDESEVMLSSGSSVNTQWGRNYPRAIDIQTGSAYSPTGIAVQKTGSYLFISHKGLNAIKVFNKSTGAAVTSFSITAPGDICTDANNDLWVISGTSTLTRYTVNSSNGTLTSASSITGLSNPLSLSSYGSLLAVVDAGTSQVKCFNISDGSSAWTLGQLNGYSSNATVANDKFHFFDYNNGKPRGFVSFGLDGSIWVGDAGNSRLLHFSSSRAYIEYIMYMPMSYTADVNLSDPTRVFSGFLEFKIDYSKTLAGTNGSWELVKNWGYGLSSAYLRPDNNTRETFKNCIKYSNGRTYATILKNYNGDDYPEVVELEDNGKLRLTGILLEPTANSVNVIIDPTDYSIYYIGEGVFYERKLTGFSGVNPVWGSVTTAATTPNESDAPRTGTYHEPVKTSTNVMVVFDRSNTHTGYHLAGIKKGTNTYAWKTSPSTTTTYTGDFPTDGTYDIGNGVEYAGAQVFAMDRNIFWNYVGEFWKNSQTNKWNHYYDNGLFINQFGITTPDAEKLDGSQAPRMAAGNAFAGGMVKVGSDYYIYHNDESVHGGLHRWKVTGLNTINEQSINLNSTYAEINVKGNNVDIIKGTNTPSTTDNTDFGSVNTGSSVNKTFVIYNTGNSSLSVTGISVTGTNASDFTLVGPPSYPLSIAASGTYTITVKFAPSAVSTRNAVLTIANSDPDEASYDFAIKGLGASTSAPDIQVSGNGVTIADGDGTPSTTDNTNLGSVLSGSSITKTFVITNAGTSALSITGCTFSGTNASEFSLVSPPSYPLSIAASGTYNITVKFAPTAVGTRNGTIIINNNDANKAAYAFALQGISTAASAPVINVQGNSVTIADGDVTPSTTDNTNVGSVVNNSSLTKTFVIQNTGTAALSVTSCTFTGTNASEFSIASAPYYPLSIAAGNSYSMTVKFAPTAVGTRTATMNVNSNDANIATYDFALQGASTSSSSPAINVQGNSVTIADGDASPSTSDNTNVGSVTSNSSLTKTFVIQNTGNAALSVTGCSFTGTNASEFSLVSAPSYPLSIAASGTYSITVKFAPTAVGTRNATINISSNAGNIATYDFALQGVSTSGSGSGAVIKVSGKGINIADGDASPNSVDNTAFGTAVIGYNIKKSFVITNAGSSSLTVTDLNFTGTYATDFSIVTEIELPLSIAANSSYTFTVKFAPLDVGTGRSAKINIYSNDSNTAKFDFSLKGSCKDQTNRDNGTADDTTSTTAVNTVNTVKKLDFVAYPNPFTENFRVRYENTDGDQSAQVIIVDVQGKTVYQQQHNLTEGINQIDINVDYLSYGIYYISFITGDKKTTKAVQKL